MVAVEVFGRRGRGSCRQQRASADMLEEPSERGQQSASLVIVFVFYTRNKYSTRGESAKFIESHKTPLTSPVLLLFSPKEPAISFLVLKIDQLFQRYRRWLHDIRNPRQQLLPIQSLSNQAQTKNKLVSAYCCFFALQLSNSFFQS